MNKGKGILILFFAFSFFFLLTALSPTTVTAAITRFDHNKVSNMSDFDPNNFVNPTGDTIKIAVVAMHSGPGAQNGEFFWLAATWVAHDYNKRGGIMVDGKKKLIQLFKADTMFNPAQTKKICEQMILQNGVKFLWGAEGSHIVKVMNTVANNHKVIAQNMISQSDDLMDSVNFSRYAFQTWITTNQSGRGMAYYFGQIRKKEKKFYILCQDYLFGHDIAEAFKAGLKEYYPPAQIVGEDYHKTNLTDFAPYLSKIKASGAEVIYTGDYVPDLANLMKQARSMGINIPFAQNYPIDAASAEALGVEKTKGNVYVNWYANGNPFFKTPEQIKYYTMWHEQWKKWKAPYNKDNYENGTGSLAGQLYWLMSVIERAASTDPEKIIKVWEGDTYQYEVGHVAKMRACDHVAVQNISVTELVPPDQQKVSFNIPPYYWNNKYSSAGAYITIPAEKVYPIMDTKLERCKGKKPSGD
jgi:branched-chain amino acid transport system substrate-binding protein